MTAGSSTAVEEGADNAERLLDSGEHDSEKGEDDVVDWSL